MITTHNNMLEGQIAQQATSSSTPLGKFPRENDLSSREQCNAMILRRVKRLEEPKEVPQNEHSHYGKDEVIEK